MNTKEMIDILYKEAEMQEQEQPANMVRWGGVLGGTMGVASSIKNRMGPKYTNGMTAKEGKTFMKNNPNAQLNKVKFGERMGNFKKSLGKGGLGGWKGMAAKTALGAGAMALGGAVATGLDNYGKERMASEIIDELYKEAQSDIKCERCGYEGKPNYNGTCPKCGLTLGKYEPEGTCGDNYRHTRENPINDFTVEELVEKAQQEEWSY